MARYSAAVNAIAICDVCGFQYRLRQLKSLVRKGKETNIKACPECWNPDHPQLHLGEFVVEDPQAVRNPRPDSAELEVSRDIQWGWNPVGLNGNDGLTPDNLEGSGAVGTVTVTTDQVIKMKVNKVKKMPNQPKVYKVADCCNQPINMKTSGVKTRGNGAATKGTMARGPMA